jgi:hypothetical protein
MKKAPFAASTHFYFYLWSQRKYLAGIGCRLAFTANGLVCFVPPETNVGDILCEFLHCDTLLIARPGEQGDNQIVGNAVNYCASASSSAPFWLKKASGAHGRDSFELGDCPISFEADIPALQWITRKSLIKKYTTDTTYREWGNYFN